MSGAPSKVAHVPAAVASLFFVAQLAIASDAPAQPVEKKPTVAFVDVNVVPMDSARVLEGQTVVVEGDHIAALGPAETIVVPGGAQVIQARGQYLMPGLADMHTHLSGVTRAMPSRELLRNYLSEGVTTIRLLGGVEEDEKLRQAITREEIVGPTIYSAGKIIVGEPKYLKPARYLFTAKVAAIFLAFGLVASLITWGVRRRQHRPLGRARKLLVMGCAALAALGAALVQLDVISFKREIERMYPWCTVVDTEDAVRAEVRRRKSEGYDLVKLYDYLSKPLYFAALDEAKKQGMYVVAHVPDEMTVEEALAGGLNEVAHLDEFMTTHMLGKAHPHSGFNEVTFDLEAVPRSAKATAEHGAMVVSNLVTDETAYQLLEGPSQHLARPEYAVASPSAIEAWKTEGRAVDWQGQQEWRRHTMQPYLMKVARALHEAGVPLLLGTDISVEGMLPWHIHRDLELLVEVGLTPFEALQAGTTNAAQSVRRAGRAGDFGVVQVGKRADLLLLKENPLEKISATRQRVGVMARGRWYPQDAPKVAERGRGD